MTTITPLPTPAPSRTEPAATFIAEGDALLGALPTMVTETNVVVGEVNAAAVTAAAEAVTAAAEAVTAGAAAATATAAAAVANAAVATVAAAPGSSATSATSATIGTGTKNLTIQTGKNFFLGMFVVIASTADPSTDWMAGQVVSYDTGTGALTVDVTSTSGSGTLSAWTVSLIGARGLPGAQAVSDTVFIHAHFGGF